MMCNIPNAAGDCWSTRGARCPGRKGVLMLEAVAALGILIAVMVVVAQTGLWGMRERARNAEHKAALELANNILEAARARPTQELTPAWADQLKLSKEETDLLSGGTLKVRVEAEKTVPSARRVVVEIHWGAAPVPRSLELVGIFSARSAVAAGGKQ
jgi:hypothetical protein